MATYNVGGLSPFNRAKTIYEAVEKALPGDEVNWSKSTKHEKAIVIRHGIHLTGNSSRFKVPEHAIGIKLSGQGHLALEDLTMSATSLANAINIAEWSGTIEFKNCNIKYRPRIRSEKAYPIVVTAGKQSNLNVIIKDCEIEGLVIDTMGTITITNSIISGVHVDSSLVGSKVELTESKLSRMAIAANLYSQEKTILRDSVSISTSDGVFKDSDFGEDGSDTRVSIYGKSNISNVRINDSISTLAFYDGDISLENITIPSTSFYTKNCSVYIHDNVKIEANWVQDETTVSNQSAEKTVHATELKALDELNSLIGLNEVKVTMENYVSMARVNKAREDANLGSVDYSLHLVFSGSPGTGKTTIANIFAKALFEEGVLKSPNVVFASRQDLIDNVIGGTAIKTRKVIDSAIGGVLFIDEAYELRSQGTRDFANEAVSELIAQMENHRKDLVVIMAGYTAEMKDLFENGNPGLKSRFSNWIEFPDYSFEELWEIMRMSIVNKYIVDNSVLDEMKLKLFTFYRDNLLSGNARFVRNFVQEIAFAQSLRLNQLSEITKADLQTITVEDVRSAYSKYYAQMTQRK